MSALRALGALTLAGLTALGRFTLFSGQALAP